MVFEMSEPQPIPSRRRFRNTRIGRLAAVLVVLVLVLAVRALATSHDSTPTTQAQPCAVLVNGNKLCGRDLAAYCATFVGQAVNGSTDAACSSVGVDVTQP